MNEELLQAKLEQLVYRQAANKKLNADPTWEAPKSQIKAFAEAKTLLDHARSYWIHFDAHTLSIRAQLAANTYVGLTNRQALWQAYCEVMVIVGRTPATTCPDDTDLKGLVYFYPAPTPTPPADEEWPPL